MIKIFVLHYRKLVDRKAFLLSQFEKHGITNFEFIEIYDVNDGDITEKERVLFDLEDPDIKGRDSMLSIILKHIHAYKLISEQYDCALILEDDAVFSDNFVEALDKYMRQLPDNYDMLFIGDGCNLHIPREDQVDGCNVYKKCPEPTWWGGDGVTRCTDSYIVSKKCATQLIEHLNTMTYKIFKAGDWWLNKVSREKQFNVYWAEPTITTQGSQIGMYCSANW
jgi:GR25 family glycosyltransferase involved in LPS biosynthesis